MPFLKKKKFWFNVHLILSLVCAPPLLIVALSGAAISYHDELIGWINTEKSSVQEGERALSAREILEKFRAREPNFTLSYFRVQNEPNAAVRVFGTDKSGEFRSYFVSPYTGKITGENYGDKLIGVALNLHVNLGLGLLKNETARLAGKHIVAASTLALIMLLITGVVIYYPSFRGKISRAFSPNFKARGYAFLYKLHGALGVWFFAALLFIGATGLYWSYDWVAKLVNGALGEKEIFRKTSFTEVRGFPLNDDEKIANLQNVFEIFKKERGDEYKFFNVIAQKDGENFMIFYIDKDAKDDENVNTMTINAPKGTVTRHARADDAQSSMLRPFTIHKAVLKLHSGYAFGEAGKFIFCLASLSILFFAASGFWMSLKRLKR